MVTARDLEKLLVSLQGTADDALEDLARSLYRDSYLNKERFGVHRTHDDQVVIFHADAFEHAFFTTSDHLCHPDRKDILRKGSIERIHWIGPLVRGEVVDSACFEVPSPTGRYRPPNRLYVVVEPAYIVWLEPRKDSGWKFKSAYQPSIDDIHKYTRGGRTVWKWKEKGPMIKPAHGATSHVPD
jgi:hypothetical protein